MQNLRGKTVLITGASSGIGAACARQFAASGANLILCARRLERLQALAKELSSVEVLPLPLDITDADAINEAFVNLPKTWQNIDILINNAGLALGREPIFASKMADLERMFDTNVKGLLYMTRQVLVNMLERNVGHIVNIGSIAGRQVYPGGNVYCASKHAVRALSQGLKLDLLGYNIKVSLIEPGMVETEFSEVRFAGDKEKARSVYQGFTPLTANDIADAVIYCTSRPAHVNIDDIILMPSAQASAEHVYRQKT